MKKILITGAGGFFGRHLINETKLKFPLCEIIEVHHNKCDLTNKFSIEKWLENNHKALQDLDCIYHLAVYAPTDQTAKKNYAKILFDNIQIDLNILDLWMKHCNNSRFITMGTSAAYLVDTRESSYFSQTPNENLLPYVTTKRILLNNLKILSLQNKNLNWNYYIPSTLFGENFSENDHHLIPDIIRKFYKNEIFSPNIHIGNYLYIKDACNIILMENPEKNVLNLCSNDNIPMHNLAQKIEKIMNKTGLTKQPEGFSGFKRMQSSFNSKYFTNFDENLKTTINWYLKSINI